MISEFSDMKSIPINKKKNIEINNQFSQVPFNDTMNLIINNTNPFNNFSNCNFLQNNIQNNYVIFNYNYNNINPNLQSSLNFQNYKNNFNEEKNLFSPEKKPRKKYQKEVLFQNTVNKEENDIKDFNNFCKCLKCDISQYICKQIGSRIMQKYLKKFPSEIRTILIKKIGKNFGKIMIDTYGNYFSQKLIKISTVEQRELIIENIKENFIEICESNGGTHVIQTLIENISTQKEKEMILNYIQKFEIELSLNQNGTHVLQKILSKIEEKERKNLTLTLLKESNIKILCVNPRGVCVIRQLIKNMENEEYKKLLIEAIYNNCKNISESPYGNYAIQFIFEQWGLNTCWKIVNFCIENAPSFSIQKYSSNIIDKLIDFTQKENNNLYFKSLLSSMINFESIGNLYTNKYGKYLLIKIFKNIPLPEKMKLKNQLIEKSFDGIEKKKISILLNIINKTDFK